MLIQRVLRAIRFDISLFQEVEANESLTGEAGLVVLLASLASGFGSFLNFLILGAGFGWALLYFILTLIFTMIAWGLAAFVCQLVGTNFFGGKATVGELLRTLGYAFAPNALLVLSFIPVVSWIVLAVVWIWTVALAVTAVREALDVELIPAVITCAIAWVVVIFLYFVPGMIVWGAMWNAAWAAF